MEQHVFPYHGVGNMHQLYRVTLVSKVSPSQFALCACGVRHDRAAFVLPSFFAAMTAADTFLTMSWADPCCSRSPHIFLLVLLLVLLLVVSTLLSCVTYVGASR